jgi:hypothetical protein
MRQAHVFYNAYNYLRNSDQILNYHLEHWFSNFLKIKPFFKDNLSQSQAPVAHTCNPSYSGGRDQEDCSSKPPQAKSLARPYLKEPFIKIWLVECLEVKALSSSPRTAKTILFRTQDANKPQNCCLVKTLRQDLKPNLS